MGNGGGHDREGGMTPDLDDLCHMLNPPMTAGMLPLSP